MKQIIRRYLTKIQEAEVMLAEARRRIPDHGLTANASRVLVYLAGTHVRNDNRRCWPALDTITRATGAHSDTVRRSLATLERLGLLTLVGERSRGGVKSAARKRRGADEPNGLTNTYRMPTPGQYHAFLDASEPSHFARVQPSQESRVGRVKPSQNATPEPSHFAISNPRKMQPEPGSTGLGPGSTRTSPVVTGNPARAREVNPSSAHIASRVLGRASLASLDNAPRETQADGFFAEVLIVHEILCQVRHCPGPRPFADADLCITYAGLAPTTQPTHPADSRYPALASAECTFQAVWGWRPDLSGWRPDERAQFNLMASETDPDDLRVGILAACWAGDARFDSALRAGVLAAELSDLGVKWADTNLVRYFAGHVGAPAHDEASNHLLYCVVRRLDGLRRQDAWPTTSDGSVNETLALWTGMFSPDAAPDPTPSPISATGARLVPTAT